MITRRDIGVALIAGCITLLIAGFAQPQNPVILQSSVFNWNEIAVKPTNVGEVRSFFRSPTTTLDELECHVTTLNPGETSHPPHKHPEEEILIVKEGTVESLVNGQLKVVGPGSVIFQASNQMHSIRNVGETKATYHVFSWHSPGSLTKNTKK